MQSTQTKQRNGLGFLVENLLNDYNNNLNEKKDNEDQEQHQEQDQEHECKNECDKKYDEIKQSILSIFKKIKQRKNYDHKPHKNASHNKNDAAFSYINYSKVREQYRELLKMLYLEKENDQMKCRAKWHITMLYRLLGYTRDISDGCGERELAYMQIFELARVDGAAAIHALKTIVSSQSGKLEKSPMGSWKDIKGLVAYMRRSMNMRDERDMGAYLDLTKYAVNIVNERLAKDVLAFYKDDNDSEIIGNGDQVSFVSKWIPRENKSKKYGNFYERLACDYYKDWLPKDRNANPVSYEKAIIKCKIHYRKLVSLLNQYLDTPQIKMCRQQWSDIAFSKTTRLTRDLQDRALLNLKPDDWRMKRHVGNADRELCAKKYKVWKCDTILHQAGIKTDLETHVRVAEYYSSCSSFSANRNAEWAAFASQEAMKKRVKRVIPVLAGNSNKAIGLALAVAENAATGRTLIVKDGSELVLHDLDASFVKNVNYLKKRLENENQNQNQMRHEWPLSSHPIYKCLISALKLLVESNVAAKETRQSEEDRFIVTIFMDNDDDSSEMLNEDTYMYFEEVLNEASLLYREFGYGVPDVVLWGMASTVCLAYKSVSHSGSLTIRIGCDASDICTYLEVENKKKEYRDCHNHNNNNRQNSNEWQNEWNDLVEMLYNRRYYDFERFFERISIPVNYKNQ